MTPDTPFQHLTYDLTPVAYNSGDFSDFGPYVPSISDSGLVSFQARLNDGTTGVFVVADSECSRLTLNDGTDYVSHPDINDDGNMAVYCETDGASTLAVFATEGTEFIGDAFESIGPLGPTMNAQGDVAFRATSLEGNPGVFVYQDGLIRPVAEVGEGYTEFFGLPVVSESGKVLFRANREGHPGIYLWHDGFTEPVFVSERPIHWLGAFPCLSDKGAVVFAMMDTEDSGSICGWTGGLVEVLVESKTDYASFRGALMSDSGHLIYYATPPDGGIGIYCGPDPHLDRLLAIGEPLLGSPVADFALNPVSINALGQFVVRVKLEDGRQFILRGDPMVL